MESDLELSLFRFVVIRILMVDKFFDIAFGERFIRFEYENVHELISICLGIVSLDCNRVAAKIKHNRTGCMNSIAKIKCRVAEQLELLALVSLVKSISK